MKQVEEAIVRYDVYASYDGSECKCINPNPVFDPGYLDVAPDSVQSVKYKIEAVW